MKVLVALKQVALAGADIGVGAGGALEASDFELVLNEWDAFALEAAIALREVHSGQIVAVTVGPAASEGVLRAAIATGADRAIRLEETGDDPLRVATALAPLAADEAPDLILCGARSSDLGNGAVGSALAALHGVAWVVGVKTITADSARASVRVTRELPRSLRETVDVPLPCLLTIQSGANQPRIPTLRAIKNAEQAPIERRTAHGVPGARVRRYAAAEGHTSGAENLGEAPADAARRILELVRAD
jgi:electron transfer flavoprotein beta subunit